MINGDYYVSIGGQDVTGEILKTKSFDYEENYNEYKMWKISISKFYLETPSSIFLNYIINKFEIWNLICG